MPGSPARLELLDDHAEWGRLYARESARVAAALAPLRPRIEHIGSTAVPGLLAKPVVDLCVVVPTGDELDRAVAPLEGLGYRHRGPHGDDPLRRYFVLDEGDRRVAQLHLWPEAAPAWREALDFRDLLREDDELREAYAREKRRAAEAVGWDKRAYSLEKGPFIEAVLDRRVRPGRGEPRDPGHDGRAGHPPGDPGDGARTVSLADRLADEVRDYFGAHGRDHGLDPDAIRVRYVLSPGGFVNHSFRVSDGRRALHLKLAVTASARAELARWHALGDALERHHAPPVLARVEIGGAAGLVFPVVPGARPALSDEVLRAVLRCLQGLWSDDRLAARLDDGRVHTAAEVYLETYHHRFVEDLRGIRSDPPPFLAARDLERLGAEAERLRSAVESHPAFDRVVSAPVHGDLWPDNILWEGEASWRIVDWDELRLGDPAIDVAMLTGPAPEDLAPLKGLDIVEEALDPDLVARLELLGRASLLDWVIDPLADWVEADVVGPGRAAEARPEKERIHRAALALYRSLYGGV